jgi:hypothetical protein
MRSHDGDLTPTWGRVLCGRDRPAPQARESRRRPPATSGPRSACERARKARLRWTRCRGPGDPNAEIKPLVAAVPSYSRAARWSAYRILFDPPHSWKVMLYQIDLCIERAPFTPQPAGSDRTMKRTSSSHPIIEQLALPYNTARMFMVQPPERPAAGIRRVASGVPAAASCAGVPPPPGSLLQPRSPLARTSIPAANDMTNRYFMTVSWMRRKAHPEEAKA